VRIAVENVTFPPIRRLFSAYGPSFLGLCYDSGHGNFVAGGGGLDELEGLKDRLISVHLHDNNGREDQHQIPFSGTVDWPRLASILAASAYTKCVSMESTMGQSGIADEREFLQKAFEAGTRLSRMVEECRASPSGFLTAP
jgi:sugar phosphate isomerase/epimerase